MRERVEIEVEIRKITEVLNPTLTTQPFSASIG